MSDLSKIHSHYNADFDVIEGGPLVTWAEKLLADYIEKLEARIAELEEKMEERESQEHLDFMTELYKVE